MANTPFLINQNIDGAITNAGCMVYFSSGGIWKKALIVPDQELLTYSYHMLWRINEDGSGDLYKAGTHFDPVIQILVPELPEKQATLTVEFTPVDFNEITDTLTTDTDATAEVTASLTAIAINDLEIEYKDYTSLLDLIIQQYRDIQE